MRALGIDLGGASSATTGFALVEGAHQPRVSRVGLLPAGESPAYAEAALLALIDDAGPDVLAIDAPLTLPPCMTCPSYCRGPDPGLCELQAAREMWAAGSNPVIRRMCEIEAKARVPKLDPKPTMGLGIIAGRAVALVRKLSNRGTPPAALERGEVLEVYPRATLLRLSVGDSRLRPRERGEAVSTYRARVVDGLCGTTVGLLLDPSMRTLATDSGHVLDALIAAYTGWLGPRRLEQPPKGFNVASGWIWVPPPHSS
jgi:predicted nuclease with RNAse H fold